MLGINGALKAIGYGLLVLFFTVGVVKACGSLAEVKRPEQALKLFLRFALAKAAVGYGLDLMLAVFQIVQGMVSTIITTSGLSGSGSTTLPPGDHRQDRTGGILGQHPLMGGDAHREPVHHRAVLCDDPDGV